MRFFKSPCKVATAVVPIAIRLITHNIRYANNWPADGEVKWEERRHLVINQLLFNTRHVPGSFIGLQEAYLKQVEDIINGLNSATAEQDWSYIGAGPDDGQSNGQFIPIIYRNSIYELLHNDTVWLSPTPDVPSKGWDAPYWNRVLTIGEFKHKDTGKKLVVMNTHLDDQGALARQKSAEMIIQRAKEYISTGQYKGILLTGDFNSEPHQEAYLTMNNATDTPFLDAHNMFTDPKDVRRYGHEHTFTGFDFVPNKRIDFLFAAPKDESPWTVEGYAVMETRFEENVTSSDHRPVLADLILN